MSLKNVFAVVKRPPTRRLLTNSEPWISYSTRAPALANLSRSYTDSATSPERNSVSPLSPGTKNTKPRHWSFDPLRELLRRATAHRDDAGLWGACRNFARPSRNHKPSQVPVTEAEKNTLLQLVLHLSDTIELGRIDALIQLLSIARTYWKVEYDTEVYSRILETLHGRGSKWTSQRTLATCRLLRMMKSTLGITPTLDQWKAFLQTAILRSRIVIIRNTPAFMRESGCTPDEEIYHLYFSALLNGPDGPPRIAVLEGYLQEMQKDGVSFTSSLLNIIVQGYAKAQLWRQVSEVKRTYEASLSLDGAQQQLLAKQKDDQLVDALREGRASSAEKLFHSFVREGYKPSVSTLDTMAKELSTVSALQRWKNLFNMEPSPSAWASIVQNALSSGRVRGALVAYDKFISSDGVPTPATLHPILRGLCSNKLYSPTDNAIDKALELFRQYRDRVEGQSETSPPSSPQQDLPLYNTLLRALTSSVNTQKYFPIATSLLEDMRKRGIVMDAMTSASFIVLLIRTSPSSADALQAYRMARHDKDGRPVLDKKGYTAVLNAFCKECISEPSGTAPYMEIVKDMRLAGHQIPVEVYTILIRQLASIANRIPSDGHEQRESLINTIRRIHSYITVEASLTPDVYLWNQLMDTYQRVGCYGDAYKVWESMRVSGEFDNVSVSIILDACAFAGAYQEAVNIFDKLRDDGFALNKKNWDTFVETLCHLGRVEEALKVVCLEMPKDKLVYPDKGTVDLVLRFAAGTEGVGEAKAQIQHYLPEVWAARES